MEHANVLDETRRYRGDNQGAGAKASHGNAGDETSPVGEPLQEYGNGHDVGKAQANAPDEAIAKVKPPELGGGEAGQEGAQAIEKTAGERDDTRSRFVQPETPEESGNAEYENADREGKCHL